MAITPRHRGQRCGLVFKLNGLCTGFQMTPPRVGRVVSLIDERAGVIVNRDDGKFASAHDLRRAFGTRWARRVKPAVLMVLMRHESIETTMKYYVDLDSDDVAGEPWKDYTAAQAKEESGNTETELVEQAHDGR